APSGPSGAFSPPDEPSCFVDCRWRRLLTGGQVADPPGSGARLDQNLFDLVRDFGTTGGWWVYIYSLLGRVFERRTAGDAPIRCTPEGPVLSEIGPGRRLGVPRFGGVLADAFGTAPRRACRGRVRAALVG